MHAVPQETINNMIAEFNLGYEPVALGKRYKLAMTTVYRILRQNGCELRNKHKSHPKIPNTNQKGSADMSLMAGLEQLIRERARQKLIAMLAQVDAADCR